ncbi:MAG: hypothetical protein ACPGJS_11600 [Flammeovirgaceae bacterium]
MATNSADHLMYFMSLPARNEALLEEIRVWDNLKMAIEGEQIWITGFTESQLKALEVQRIPYKSLYYAQNNKLFPLTSLLPSRMQPNLLWTPIAQALPVEVASFNHNFFGLNQQVEVTLVPTHQEQEAVALLGHYTDLNVYMKTAPAIRLKNLKWVLINQTEVLIWGTPLLPIPGTAYWQKFDFLIPLGYDFDLPILGKTLNELLNPQRQQVVLWNVDSSHTAIPKSQFEALRISSFRKTMKQLFT